ncbi:MAG: phosphohydrolase, partial [Tardiphaga sp.]|nr:phosphohydrolase [Tardiphaga sp.]
MTASVTSSPVRRRLLLASDRNDRSAELADILKKVGDVEIIATADIPETPGEMS